MRAFVYSIHRGLVSFGVLLLIALALGYAGLAVGQESAPAGSFKAGFARVDITPAAGCQMPGGFSINLAQGVHDPLWAEAAVFINGGFSLAVVGSDTIMIPAEVVAEARKQAELQSGIPGSHIMIGASHTHNGGPIVACLGSDSDPAYCTLVAGRIAEAVRQAHMNAVDARLGVGSGEEGTVGFNRRFKMKDGTVRTHPGKMNPDIVEPAGPIDPEVGVLGVETVGGELLGCIVNYALHGTTMGGSKLSADWPCYLRSTIRGGLGKDIGVVFLNGACGDVTQVDNRSARASEFGEAWSRRVGMTVGAEALKVLARMEFSGDVALNAAQEVIHPAIRDLAGTDEELVARETPGNGLGTGQNPTYLKEAGLVRAMKSASPTVAVEVQAFRIGPAAIVSNTTEYFCSLGLTIKQGSPWRPTMVSELTNGYNGYSPTQEAFQGGGYEIRTARSSYLIPGAGEQIAEASLRVLNRLKE